MFAGISLAYQMLVNRLYVARMTSLYATRNKLEGLGGDELGGLAGLLPFFSLFFFF